MSRRHFSKRHPHPPKPAPQQAQHQAQQPHRPSQSQEVVEGRLQLRGRFGFVLSEDPKKPDIYVSGPSLQQAMDGDRVQVKVIPGRRREGMILKVVQRARSTMVGIYRVLKGQPVVAPEDNAAAPVHLLGPKSMQVQEGQAVVVKITQWPHAQQPAGGVLHEILGWPQDPGVDTRMILRKRELQEDFPAEVLRETAALQDSVPPSAWAGRRNFFDLTVCTIDGADAKDFDDAVSLEKLPSGLLRLGVHIADASEYVQLGTDLDKEAGARATSVYPVGTVVPMLPPKLSENLCSLMPRVERLTLSCLMELDRDGAVRNYEIVEGVIRSARRCTYDEVQEILDRPSAPRDPVEKLLVEMNHLARTLRARRMRRGALDFEFPESKVILDNKGRPLDIVRVEARDSHKLIEEFMLLANETVASHLIQRQIPGMFRVHEKPDREKLRKLVDTLKVFGVPVPNQFTEGTHQALGQVLRSLRGKPYEHVLDRLILRTLKQAVYASKNAGHFGLASANYTHFTSPIRRYPDLCVHRVIKARLRGQVPTPQKSWEHSLPQLAQHCSARERLAQEAEWDSRDLKRVQFMKDKLGDTFTAVISSVMSFGFFVELTDFQVEGLVRVESLEDDYYIYDETRLSLRGKRKHRVFHPGLTVKVRLADANEAKRQLEFQLVKDK